PTSALELVSAAESALGRWEPLPPPPRRSEAAAAADGPLDDTLVDPIPILPEPPVIETEPARAVSWPLLAAAAAVAAVALVLGAGVGGRQRGGGGSDDRRLAGGALGITAPAAWRTGSAAGLPLGFEHPLALVPRPRPRAATFVMGTARAEPPTFLP